MEVPGFEIQDNSKKYSYEQNKNIKKGSKKKGGFQTMGLSFNVLKGIIKRGYKVPTPIQRKAIPIVMEGRDVVAMARTGSGKTACFLIPLFERLKVRSAKSGARALILSPTRELVLQTFKFTKELGKYTGLKAAVILGGDSMEDQFSAIHGNPDIIVATPGRFLHVCVEMDLKLKSVEYVVFDEADRLFEMGFGEQLTEIVNRLPDSRQTLLFSATLPRVLVDFAKAGLNDPVLIRLDVESKLPSELKLVFITVRPEEKVAALLVLLKNCIPVNQQTVIFAATKHHVEYLHLLLDRLGISNTYIYSNLDPSARKIHAAKFSAGKTNVLVVTDIAARGIDIPQLDNVINFNFPAKSKLFIHRVGRCARAGRTGTAYSLVTSDEHAYLLDLHLFLGRPLSLAPQECDKDNIIVGKMPQSMIEEQQSTLLALQENDTDLVNMSDTCNNAYKQYIKSRPLSSADSNRRVKQMPFSSCGIHPIFKDQSVELENSRESFLDQMKFYRPPGTIFEICGKSKSADYLTMKNKRAFHKQQIERHREKLQVQEGGLTQANAKVEGSDLPTSTAQDVENTFNKIILPKKRKIDELYKKKKKIKDDDHFIPYTAPDRYTEEGLAVNNFENEATKAQLDLTADSTEMLQAQKQQLKWDRKKKKLVSVSSNQKVGKIKTESGVWIPSSYKSDRYAQWKEKIKVSEQDDEERDEEEEKQINKFKKINTHWAKHNEKLLNKQRESELKRTDQILKARRLAEKKKQRQKRKKIKRNSKQH